MDIQNQRFDMTDPFAQVKQRVAQAEILMQQMPPAQRRALVAAMQTPISTRTPRSIDGPVTMASVWWEECWLMWAMASSMPATTLTEMIGARNSV